MIIIYTCAYNAEKTLPLTINSILSQTEQNFTYYLCDNGSTDGTRTVVLNSAGKDNRIIPILRDINHRHPDFKGNHPYLEFILTLCQKEPDNAFFCNIDADDEYTPDFLEKMLAFINENNLDVAACGHYFINAETKKSTGIRNLKNNLILENENFNEYFSQYHQFMRTIWCKLYRVSLLKKCGFDSYDVFDQVAYGIDTLICMRAFSKAARAGILAEPLHKYYVSPKSVSYKFNNKRIQSDQILHDETVSFLLEKVGYISHQNNKFLYLVYFNAIIDTLKVLFNAKLDFSEKIKNIFDIITHKTTQNLLNNGCINDNELNEKLRDPILKLLLSHKESRRLNNIKITSEIFASMYQNLSNAIDSEVFEYLLLKMPETIKLWFNKDYEKVIDRLQTWFKRHDQDDIPLTKLEIAAYRQLNKNDAEMYIILTDIKNNRIKSCEMLEINKEIEKLELSSHSPLLNNVSKELISVFPNTFYWILKNNFTRALDDFLDNLQEVEIPDNDYENCIIFGQNLAALVEDAAVYIYFKKLQASYYIDISSYDKAKREIDELIEMLPDDEEIIELKRNCYKKMGIL